MPGNDDAAFALVQVTEEIVGEVYRPDALRYLVEANALLEHGRREQEFDPYRNPVAGEHLG